MVLLFDVNETLLDLGALRPHVARIFGADDVLPLWFARLLHTSTVCALTDTYVDFGDLAGDTLAALAADRGVALADADRAAVLDQMRRLDPHPDVVPALERLRAAGVRLAALTNSGQATADAQIDHAGLRGYFEAVLSVEAVRRFKPAPEPYRMAAERLGVAPRELTMVAAHDWDIHGAQRAGCQGAYVARGGKTYHTCYDAPDAEGADLNEVATLLSARTVSTPMKDLMWLQAWYRSHCDGDWEHMYGVEIRTVDNPGWMLKVDLHETEFEDLQRPWQLVERDEGDWYGFKVESGTFEAAGDATKLGRLLQLFREWVGDALK